MTHHRLSFIVATKDRPRELARLIESLKSQTIPPDEVVLVDGGMPPLKEAIWRGVDFPVKYLRCRPPSATKQRNQGLLLVGPGIDLIGFIDDDAVLEPNALEEMLMFWNNAPDDVAGAGFNQVNHLPVEWPALKSTPLAEALGIYSRRAGVVTSSGFQTMPGVLGRTTYVQWLATGAAAWRRSVFVAHRFDEWYDAYSYLEDLDFSYAIGKERRLVIVAAARYYHLPPLKDRGGDYRFGRREVKARFHFVAKNPELSLRSCLMALILRMGISLALMVKKRRPAFAGRILGNLVGLAEVAAGGSRNFER